MFGLFTSAQKRARHDAQNWLHLAGKIYHFRRDQLPVQEIEALQLAVHELRTRVKEKADAAKLKMGMEKLEGCLRRSGGTFYPKSSIVDNVEFFLVAMILFLGIRAFIVQPFKIPTNSMWPTYNGLTAEAYVAPEQIARVPRYDDFGTIALEQRQEEAGRVERLMRWAMFGASARRLDAPMDGEVMIPWIDYGVPRVPVKARKWLVIPDEARKYTLLINDREVSVTVPVDFRFDSLIAKVFFGDKEKLGAAIQDARKQGRYGKLMPTLDPGSGAIRSVQPLLLSTGVKVRAGDRALSFDILTGDQLFVDRVSYHFFSPQPGDGFVFRTQHILGVETPGKYSDKYYIKRLVGIPGDTLEVKGHTLIRNGAPIEGSSAFEKNALQEDRYPGYDAMLRLAPGRKVEVEPDHFFAMGDNSPDSADSRYWGFVPAGDVVGRPLWVYFPFTRRWGPAR